MGSAAIDREDLAERLKSRGMPAVRLDRALQEGLLREKRTDIDWEGVQRERNSGAMIHELAAKYRVHKSMIYSHTRPAIEKNGTARRGRPRKLAAPVDGDELPAILTRLKAKRDKLNSVISALEDL